MRIDLICPAPRGSRLGNRVTATRWRRILRGLGHVVTIHDSLATSSWGRGGGPASTPWSRPERPADIVVALHALKSAEAVRAAHESTPRTPVVLALTGTDLYRDVRIDPEAKRSLEIADRLVVLQREGVDELPAHLRAKTRVIHQSVQPRSRSSVRKATRTFDLVVVGHLRDEKDPFRAAEAARLLRPESRIRVLHAGRALTPEMADRAEREGRENPRYRWLGELYPGRARRLMASSRGLVLTSRIEGGANVIGEAIVERVPVIASRIPSSEGLLGAAYPGFFPVEDTHALAVLMERLEREPALRRDLEAGCRRVRPLFSPRRESDAWRALLREISRLPSEP